MLSCEFGQGVKDIALVISPKLYNFKSFIGQHYGIPLKRYEPVIINRLLGVSTFERQDGKKPTKKELQPHIDDLLESADTLGIKYLIIANAEYFKWLTGRKGLEDSLGLSYQCVIAGYAHLTVFPMINASILLAQPNKKILLDKAIRVVGETINGSFQKPKAFEFESYELVQNPQRAKVVLDSLLDKPRLFVDIETASLLAHEADVLTIAFAWDSYNAVTFACHELYLSAEYYIFVVDAIKNFFKVYTGECVYHNALYDVKVLVRQWYMTDHDDLTGIYEGLEALGIARTHDTMLMAFAEYNSTERPQLGLKDLSKDFLGEYAIDTKNNREVPLATLAEYNAKDCCGTSWVYETVKHQQTSRIYTEILQPSLEYLIHEMLNGIPLDMSKVLGGIDQTDKILQDAYAELRYDPYVKQTEDILANLACLKYNSSHVKQKEPWEFIKDFNPASPNQLKTLLFDVMGFEPIEFTATGQPKTDRASIKEFIGLLTEDDDKLTTMAALVAISETGIIKTTFLETFRDIALCNAKGEYTLHGNHRLAGPISGRLSSNSPNLANMPSSSRYGKLIKACFKAPPGWLYFYADYNALEDRISCALANDRAKLDELINGYDGHSLRAYAFFKEELEERGLVLDPTDPQSINRIQQEAKDLRQNAKPISFLKIYGGGAGKIQKVLKCSMSRAQEISDAYDELYKDTMAFNAANIVKAKRDGWLDVAFGLRVRCPRINARDGAIASSEARSVNNSVSQSYGMLTNLASKKFLDAIKTSKYRMDVKLINQVHDCLYGLVREDAVAVQWVNETLVPIMRWKDDPAIRESIVTMEAEVDIGYDGAHCVTIANNASLNEIISILGGLNDLP
jgi:DNA polymerase-1